MKLILLALLVTVATVTEARPDRNAQILRDDREGPREDGSYFYAFETSNQIAKNEEGNPGSQGQINADGSYTYTDEEGNRFSLSYVANEEGFQPRGDHIPPAPPHVADLLRIAADQRARGIRFDRRK